MPDWFQPKAVLIRRESSGWVKEELIRLGPAEPMELRPFRSRAAHALLHRRLH